VAARDASLASVSDNPAAPKAGMALLRRFLFDARFTALHLPSSRLPAFAWRLCAPARHHATSTRCVPAVMIYNLLARSTAQYRALIGDASALIMNLVSRDLDRAKAPLHQAAE